MRSLPLLDARVLQWSSYRHTKCPLSTTLQTCVVGFGKKLHEFVTSVADPNQETSKKQVARRKLRRPLPPKRPFILTDSYLTALYYKSCIIYNHNCEDLKYYICNWTNRWSTDCLSNSITYKMYKYKTFKYFMHTGRLMQSQKLLACLDFVFATWWDNQSWRH